MENIRSHLVKLDLAQIVIMSSCLGFLVLIDSLIIGVIMLSEFEMNELIDIYLRS